MTSPRCKNPPCMYGARHPGMHYSPGCCISALASRCSPLRIRRVATSHDIACLWRGLFCLILVLGVNVFNRHYIPAIMNELTYKTTLAQLVVLGLCAILGVYNWYVRRRFITSEAISTGARANHACVQFVDTIIAGNIGDVLCGTPENFEQNVPSFVGVSVVNIAQSDWRSAVPRMLLNQLLPLRMRARMGCHFRCMCFHDRTVRHRNATECRGLHDTSRGFDGGGNNSACSR